MIRVLIVSMFITLSVAVPAPQDIEAKILSYENNNYGQGNYDFSFETSNGIKRREFGQLVNFGQPDEHVEVEGEYSYTDPEGKLVEVNYWADENGYHVGKRPVVRPSVAFGLPSAAVATLLG